MERTEFSEANKEFTDIAHEAAKSIIYPAIFPTSTISYRTTDVVESHDEDDDDIKKQNIITSFLDGCLGIDRILTVKTKVQGKYPTLQTYTVQERFRRPSHQGWQDITLTHFNRSSNQFSETSKLAADLFVYGYFDSESNEFPAWVAVPCLLLKMALKDNVIDHTTNENNKGQIFHCIGFDELQKLSNLQTMWSSPLNKI